MLQATVLRTDAAGFSAPVVVTGEDHRFMVQDQLADVKVEPAVLLLEPTGRNTAPAIGLAAHWLERQSAGELMLVMPSDHVINDLPAFMSAIEVARPLAQEGRIVTFGITPDHPETGYGYIEAGEPCPSSPLARDVLRFVEKPDLELAKSYVAGGNHFWNGGIFLLRADIYLQELRTHAPLIDQSCAAALGEGQEDGRFYRPGPSFASCPAISIDYAVMEATKRAAVIPVQLGWSDVGSWNALWDVAHKNDARNAVQGPAVAIDCEGSLLRSDDGPLIAAVGLRDMVVVATRDAILVMPRARAQDTKLIVDKLKELGSDIHQLHPKVHRPWGSYEGTDRGKRFQTKRITVKPGAKLSLQMHHHRSEHWIVVSGTARVTVGDEIKILQENESTYRRID